MGITKFGQQGSKTGHARITMKSKESFVSRSRAHKVSFFASKNSSKERTLSRGLAQNETSQRRKSNVDSREKMPFYLNFNKIGLQRGIMRASTARGSTPVNMKALQTVTTKATPISKGNQATEAQYTSTRSGQYKLGLFSQIMNTMRASTPNRSSLEQIIQPMIHDKKNNRDE